MQKGWSQLLWRALVDAEIVGCIRDAVSPIEYSPITLILNTPLELFKDTGSSLRTVFGIPFNDHIFAD